MFELGNGCGGRGGGGRGIMMRIHDVTIQKPSFPYLNKVGRLMKSSFFNYLREGGGLFVRDVPYRY